MADFSTTHNSPLQRRLWVLDGTVLLALAILILYTVSKHEPWADEAQAWLVARDFRWWPLVFGELRYEGHPPVWFAILSIAIHVFHMPYAYLGYLGGALAILGLAVLIFLAPFPRILRCLIAASFFFVYQYAVIARPYVLVPLLAFFAAHFYRRGLSRITTFAVLVVLLIQLNSYGAVIGLGLSAFYGLQLMQGWKDTSAGDRRRIIAAGCLVAASAILVVIVLYPRTDSALMLETKGATFLHHIQVVGEGLVGALNGSAFVAFPLLAFAGVWAYQWNRLLALIFCVGGTALVYGFLRGYEHHQGLILIGFVVFLWAAWPTAAELGSTPRRGWWLHHCFVPLLMLLFAWQCTWSYAALRNEWAGPYSGAKDAAEFLKSVHADRLGCSGYSFWAVGVQPYFDHNIFLNWGGPEARASYHWATGFQKRSDVLMASQAINGPPFIVLSNEFKDMQEVVPMVESMRSVNYVLVHFSDGTRFFKDKKGVHASYFVFAKADFAPMIQNQSVPNSQTGN